MTRRGGSCGRCGARRHGKRRHVSGSAAMTDCERCSTPLCSEHARWDSGTGSWVCSNKVICERTARGR